MNRRSAAAVHPTVCTSDDIINADTTVFGFSNGVIWTHASKHKYYCSQILRK